LVGLEYCEKRETVSRSSPKTHLHLGKIVESPEEDLVVDTPVIGQVAEMCVSIVFIKSVTGGRPYKISVSLSCHGGYPFNCTVGLNKINRSGSLET